MPEVSNMGCLVSFVCGLVMMVSGFIILLIGWPKKRIDTVITGLVVIPFYLVMACWVLEFHDVIPWIFLIWVGILGWVSCVVLGITVAILFVMTALKWGPPAWEKRS